jgi:MFS family permease
MLWPAMIGLACAAVGEANRGFAMGLVMGTCSIGNAAGPVMGGILTEAFSWRWVLWVNVPMALVAVAFTLWGVPADPPSGNRSKNDFAGMSALTGGLVALMVAVYQSGAWGWGSPRILGLLVVAAVLLGLFPWLETRVANPLVPPDLLHHRELRALVLAAMGICQLFFIVLLYFTQYALKFLGDSPMWAGARVVPFMLSYGAVSYLGGPLYARFGARKLLASGLIGAAVASALLAVVGPGTTPLLAFSLQSLLGMGVGAVIPTISTRAVENAGVARASLVGGIVFMVQLSGAALLLAVGTAIFAESSHTRLEQEVAAAQLQLSPDQQIRVEKVLTGAKLDTAQALAQIPGGNADKVIAVVQAAYGHGVRLMLCMSTLLVLGTLWLVLQNVPARAHPKLGVPPQSSEAG